MLRWFQMLMPKETRFFGLFGRHAEAIVAGAQALRAMLEGGDAVEPQFNNVMDREHEADDCHTRYPYRGAEDLHHAFRPWRYQGPDHVDG